MEITIFGKGNMGQAIGKNFADAGNDVQYYGSKDTAERLGNIVIMAVPYPALAALAKQYQTKLAGKIVVDITNPLNFETFDELVVPADSATTAEAAAGKHGTEGFQHYFRGYASKWQNW